MVESNSYSAVDSGSYDSPDPRLCSLSHCPSHSLSLSLFLTALFAVALSVSSHTSVTKRKVIKIAFNAQATRSALNVERAVGANGEVVVAAVDVSGAVAVAVAVWGEITVSVCYIVCLCV